MIFVDLVNTYLAGPFFCSSLTYKELKMRLASLVGFKFVEKLRW